MSRGLCLATVVVCLASGACSSSEVAAGSGAEMDAGGAPADGGARTDRDDRGADAASPSAPPANSPVSRHGRLKVVGNTVRDERGGAVRLRGMSLFWSQWGGAFWNAEVVDTLVEDWGATVVRAPMGVEEGGYLTEPVREKARVEGVVAAAVARGAYVIVDWHDHNAHLHTEQATAFFSEMAGKYGQTPNVVFEIYNEPVGTPWADVKAYARTVIAAIRAQGSQNLVIVGTPQWSQDVDVAAADPVDDANVAYALHFYAATHKAALRDKAVAAMDAGAALFVTEWGTSEASGDGSLDLEEAQRWIDFMGRHELGWCNWSLFDKRELASALVPGASPAGRWADSSLTDSGRFVKARIAAP